MTSCHKQTESIKRCN